MAGYKRNLLKQINFGFAPTLKPENIFIILNLYTVFMYIVDCTHVSYYDTLKLKVLNTSLC